MSTHKLPLIEVGFQVFASHAEEAFGAVRDVLPAGRPELVVNIEGAGDFTIALTAVTSVHDQKVIVDVALVEAQVRQAIRHAHEQEQPGL